MPDSSAIDDALVSKLLADATLAGLCPDGVFFDEGNARSRRFVVVSFVHQDRSPVFDGAGIENTIYSVKAVVHVETGGNVGAAAARIDELLDDGVLTVPGFELIAMFRDDTDGRIRYTEVDERDKTQRWQHRGARYRVQVTPIPMGDTRGRHRGEPS